MSFLDTLRAKGVDFKRSNADPYEVSINCPFCEFRSQSIDTRFRLGINIRTGQGHCFNCDWASHENALQEVSNALQLEFDAFDAVVSGEAEEQNVTKPEGPTLPEDFTLLADRPKGILYRKAYAYICNRGVQGWQIEGNSIGVSLCGQYAYRIILPVYHNKKLQGLVTRDFTGQQALPYLNTPGMKSLYGSPEKSSRRKLVLCEGAFDRFAIEQVVERNEYDVKALLGRSITEQQQAQLKDYRDIVLWPDNDMAGVKGFLEVANVLKLEHRVFMTYPFGHEKDAGAMHFSGRKYVWSTRARHSEALEMNMRAEIAFRE